MTIKISGKITAPSLQFLVAPYSLFVSLALAAALSPPIYCCHYIVYTLLGAAVTLLTSVSPPAVAAWLDTLDPWLHLTIGPAFILAFFMVDQLLCLYCHLMTPCKQFTLREASIEISKDFLLILDFIV